jgi:hypothetical protein
VQPLRIALILAVVCSTADAQIFQVRQPRLSDQWVFGINTFGGIPVGDFRRYEDGGGGMEVSIGFQPFRRQPLVLRASTGFLMYGHYDRDETQNVCDYFGNYCRTETVFYNSRYHNMSFFQFGPEIMATDGRWRPFGFALAGKTLFNSWANYGPPSNSGRPPTRTLLSTQNFSTAYGLGVRRVATTFGREGGFELALRMTRNGKATYLNDDGVHRRPDLSYDITPRTGAANVVGIHVGFWMGPYRNWNEH